MESFPSVIIRKADSGQCNKTLVGLEKGTLPRKIGLVT